MAKKKGSKLVVGDVVIRDDDGTKLRITRIEPGFMKLGGKKAILMGFSDGEFAHLHPEDEYEVAP